MKIKKSILALVLTTVVGVSIVGCGKDDKKASTEEKKTEVTASTEEKQEDETKAEEEKQDDETKAEEEKQDEAKAEEVKEETTTQTTTQTATATTQTATASSSAATTAPTTAAQKLDALVKGLNATVRDFSQNEKDIYNTKAGKVIAYSGKMYAVIAITESSATPAQKAQFESYRKLRYAIPEKSSLKIAAYYNKGIVIFGNVPGAALDPKIAEIMDTFK